MEQKSKNPIQVADRLFLTLETLAETGPTTLADLQNRLQLNKSTVHRLLTSLIYLGYVQQNPVNGRYCLSFKILSLSNQMLEKLDILDTLRPHLKQLAADTGETVHFVQADGTEAVYIAKEESYQNSVRMVSKVGSRIPLYCSGVGKAILADLPSSQVQAIWKASAIRPLTLNTITDYAALLSHLKQIRLQGYAIDNEENEIGVRCIAISLPHREGQPPCALSVSAPVTRMGEERIKTLAEVMRKKKQELEKILSYPI